MKKLTSSQKFIDEHNELYKAITGGAIVGLQKLRTGEIAWFGRATTVFSLPLVERFGKYLFGVKIFRAVG